MDLFLIIAGVAVTTIALFGAFSNTEAGGLS
jgi:hypothetical protein